MQLPLASALLLGFSATLVAQQPLLETLSQSSIQSAFQILRRDYIRRESLSFEELNRAALQGLLERLDLGAELVQNDPERRPGAPAVHAEFIGSDIAYLRPETYGDGESILFATELKRLSDAGAKQVILDLRVPINGSFDEAARMLECFTEPGEVLFKLQQIGRSDAELFVSKKPALWKARVFLLVDGQTGNTAETVAACLVERKRALVLGEKTRGGTVRYTEVHLDDKTHLRYASAEMLLPSGAAVFLKGVDVNFPVPQDGATKEKIFTGSRGGSMKTYVMDRVRPRYNEAALVKGSNPELDDYIRKTKGQPLPGDEGQVRDAVVQRALDLVQSERFVGAARIKWPEAVKQQTPAAPPKEENE